MDYGNIAIRMAAKHVTLRKARVLVVGANRGEQCEAFANLGAPEVHGLDICDTVGADFQDPRATYHRSSIEATTLPSNTFDLVFAFATMEHVPNIEAAFAEMARVTKPGGAIFCTAAPLRHSAYGHHMPEFEGHPWIHLAKSESEIVDFVFENGIKLHSETRHLVHYMLDRQHFNQRRPAEYLAACNRLADVSIARNGIDFETRDLNHPYAVEAVKRGHTRDDLLGINHRFVAYKKSVIPSPRSTAVLAAYRCKRVLGHLAGSWRK